MFSLSSQQGGPQGDSREAGLRGGGEHVFRAVGQEGKCASKAKRGLMGFSSRWPTNLLLEPSGGCSI